MVPPGHYTRAKRPCVGGCGRDVTVRRNIDPRCRACRARARDAERRRRPPPRSLVVRLAGGRCVKVGREGDLLVIVYGYRLRGRGVSVAPITAPIRLPMSEVPKLHRALGRLSEV